MLCTDGEVRIQGSVELLCRMNASLQPSIRRGHLGDLPQVLALLQDAGLPTSDLRSIQGLQLWVLQTKDALVGVIALERFGSDALLRSLAVVATYRKRGYGHELVARLEQDAQAAGIEQLVLLTETAEPFFRSLGYVLIDRRCVSEELKQSAEFRSLCPVSAVCMSKALHSHRAAES
jgi:amino-acid N-acetyltransferase